MTEKVIQSVDHDLDGYGKIKQSYDDLNEQLADMATQFSFVDGGAFLDKFYTFGRDGGAFLDNTSGSVIDGGAF